MTIRLFRAARPFFLAPLATAAMAGLILMVGASAARAADMEVEISGVTTSGAGTGAQVLVAAFTGGEGWLRQPVAVGRAALSSAKAGVVTVRLTGLPDAPVGLSVFQDQNGNGKLDRNAMGMPIEPYAFSRQAQGNFGPPSFEQAALPAGTARHAIQLPAQN
ncbi:DUF2141 domain-containing protein [Roseateles chitosanitabidus]|uniref:DUF2141 domain-containing protein n=1 Tax=Roseateles chitosanitabidus TaxID=65048 RepID=UPI000831211C|nr:DUF2141 domain-containing protein [Roseateles chitosanitabidus]